MRTLIAAFLIIICIPSLIMSAEFEIPNKFEPEEEIKAKKFNQNYKAIEDEIAALRSEISKLKNLNSQLLSIEASLENLQAQLKKPKPYGSFNFRKTWIKELGKYGPAKIEVEKGDIVKVDLIGSASESEFYYSIVETTGQAVSIDAFPQVIMISDYKWKSITAVALFRAKADTTLEFKADFIKGDVSGRIQVFGLTLIATVLGSEAS